MLLGNNRHVPFSSGHFLFLHLEFINWYFSAYLESNSSIPKPPPLSVGGPILLPSWYVFPPAFRRNSFTLYSADCWKLIKAFVSRMCRKLRKWGQSPSLLAKAMSSVWRDSKAQGVCPAYKTEWHELTYWQKRGFSLPLYADPEQKVARAHLGSVPVLITKYNSVF